MEERGLRLICPWQDRNRRFSSLKALTLAFMVGPALWLLYSTAAGEFGITPLGELTFWSGIWSMAILLLALAITPGATMFRWSRLIIVRRMIGVTALVYTLAHIVIYFALRLWDFTVIGKEMATSVSLLAATVSTIGLVALGALYLLGVAIYMGTLAYASVRTDAVEAQVDQIGPTYTNAIQLRDRFKVLKERQELKYAGLDCWSTTARLLRENMILESMSFSEVRRLNLSGTAPGDQTDQLYAFEGDMRKATIRGEPLFDANKGESIQFRITGAIAAWTLSLELKRSELQ